MAKALESLFSDLTPLQQAALERIQEYKEELKGYGLYVRSAIELEFFTEGADGTPIGQCINLNGLHRNLHDMLPAPDYLQAVNFEALGGLGFYARAEPQLDSQYEIRIAEPETSAPERFQPEVVLGITKALKKSTLNDALQNTSSLTQLHQNMQIRPNFSVRPYMHAKLDPKQFKNYDQVTSALHINASLYDKKGNVFAHDAALQYQCADSLLELQTHAGLALLPSQDSLHRIHANNSTPFGIGVSIGHNVDDKPKNNRGKRSISVRVIREPNAETATPEANSHTRIENRLPGMDADPFVAMAVTMGALVDAVRRKERGEISDAAILKEKLLGVQRPIDRPEEIPDAHQRIVEKYRHAAHARELLGSKLYGAILQEYGKTPSVTR